MRRVVGGLALAVVLAAFPAAAMAAPPNEPAGGTSASCAGVAFSDHATGNADTTMRQVIHEELPFIMALTGLKRGELAKLFVQIHEPTHAACEEALFEALFP